MITNAQFDLGCKIIGWVHDNIYVDTVFNMDRAVNFSAIFDDRKVCEHIVMGMSDMRPGSDILALHYIVNDAALFSAMQQKSGDSWL